MIEVFGEVQGCRMFRKVAPWYARRFGPASYFNKRVVQISTRADFEGLISEYVTWRRQFLDESGRLLPRYEPAPLKASFLEDDAQGGSIRVPKGPVERW
jgi:hypothetical protein